MKPLFNLMQSKRISKFEIWPRLILFQFLIHHLGFSVSYAQDSTYTHYVLYSLTNEFMGGRGYVFNGDKRAADFIRYEFKHDSLTPLTEKYLQPFFFSVNTFPKRMSLIIDAKTILFP